MRKFKRLILVGVAMTSSLFASEWCTESHADFQKLSKWSGCMPRPVLLVHGFNADMGSVGANPYFNKEDIEGRVKAYKRVHNMPSQIASYYNASLLEDEVNGINNNGVEFYNAKNPEDLPDNTPEYIPEESSEVDHEIDYGQAGQLYVRLKKVLNEYYGDAWKTDTDLRVDLIGHSQGGIVIRYMVDSFRSQSLENPVNHVNQIITLGTPNLGTEWASTPVNKSGHSFVDNIVLAGLGSTFFSESLRGIIGPMFAVGQKYWNQDYGDIATNLNSNGHPTVPINGEQIPVTTMYATAEGFTNKRLAEIEADKQGGYDWAREDCVGPTGWCKDFAYTEWLARMGAEKAFMENLRDYWAPRGDLVSTVQSQRGDGVFDVTSGRYRSLKFAGSTPHGRFMEIDGIPQRGYEIVLALITPPGYWEYNLNIVPTIITPLLLN